MHAGLNVFISYSHNDTALCKQLEAHLSPLRRSGLINLWYDYAITAGAEWEEKITTQLEKAHLILLLVSPDFSYSEYCHSTEMKRAMKRHQTHIFATRSDLEGGLRILQSQRRLKYVALFRYSTGSAGNPILVPHKSPEFEEYGSLMDLPSLGVNLTE